MKSATALSQKLAALFPPLLIEAERVAQSVWQGTHGRRRAGVGETFWQFRPYEAHDSAGRIDWRQSARSAKTFVREKEWEAVQTAYVWADRSGSMQYASSPALTKKADRAALLMLALAQLLLRSGEKIGWIDGAHITPAYGAKGIEAIAATLQNPPPASVDTPGLLPPLPLARHAHMILASDFLASADDMAHTLHAAAARGIRGALLHILDPIEENFALQGRVELLGLEGEGQMLVPNAEALRAAYAEKMRQHKTKLQSLAAASGWFYTAHITRDAPQVALMALYQALVKSN